MLKKGGRNIIFSEQLEFVYPYERSFVLNQAPGELYQKCQ